MRSNILLYLLSGTVTLKALKSCEFMWRSSTLMSSQSIFVSSLQMAAWRSLSLKSFIILPTNISCFFSNALIFLGGVGCSGAGGMTWVDGCWSCVFGSGWGTSLAAAEAGASLMVISSSGVVGAVADAPVPVGVGAPGAAAWVVGA